MNIPTLKTQYSKINNLLYMSYLPKVINAAIDINLFDSLSGKNLSLNEIVEKLNTRETVTEALLNVLVEIDLLIKKDNKYSLSGDADEYLVKNSEINQLQAVKRFTGSTGPFDYLVAVLQGEVPSFNEKMWSSKEAILAMEHQAKAGAIQNVVSFVKTIPEFDSFTKMCDFAGNAGYYSYALLNENQNLCSHVYDLPAVCQVAKEIKQEEKDFDRISYHDFDMKKNESFGEGYDFFFSSHFLYELTAEGCLATFLKKISQSMKPGGIFVSNHICNKSLKKEDDITLSLVELQTRIIGYPTHQLPETRLKEELTKAGFGNFRTKQPDGSHAFSTLLLSAKKKK